MRVGHLIFGAVVGLGLSLSASAASIGPDAAKTGAKAQSDVTLIRSGGHGGFGHGAFGRGGFGHSGFGRGGFGRGRFGRGGWGRGYWRGGWYGGYGYPCAWPFDPYCYY